MGTHVLLWAPLPLTRSHGLPDNLNSSLFLYLFLPFLMAWGFSVLVYTYAIFICLLKKRVQNKTSYINFRGFEEASCYWSPLFFSAFSFHIWSTGITRFFLKLVGFAPGCKHCSSLLPQVSRVCYMNKGELMTSWYTSFFIFPFALSNFLYVLLFFLFWVWST